MTAEEAMKIRQNPSAEHIDIKELNKCIDEALKKQIPAPVIMLGFNGSICTAIGCCPICDGKLLRECDFKYCPDCGQRLDWSDTDES